MFEISWGELGVVTVVGLAVIGRKDLPAASRMVGTQLGRVVGLLQGARARADRYAAQNELRQLQNELRSGLRELDQVRTELAVAASSQGMVGRSLGATTPSANRTNSGGPSASTFSPANHFPTNTATTMAATASAATNISSPQQPLHSITSPTAAVGSPSPTHHTSPDPSSTISHSHGHSERAVLEDEWEKQGIGYQTRAEQIQKGKTKQTGNPSGSEILQNLIKDSLTWDQYDKVVAEQEQQVQQRITAMEENRNKKES
eukprot:Nitzschia sp. Nitz4//scaffold91_size79674//7707//8486//NITZ4_005355-RA/size79674-processed-gene-0.101-mRNA-1//-1//CDS//3329560064//2246//frame0